MILRIIICILAVVLVVLVFGYLYIYFQIKEDEFSRGPLGQLLPINALHYKSGLFHAGWWRL